MSNWASVRVIDVYVDTMPTFLAGLTNTSYTSLVPMGGGGQTWDQERNGMAWPTQVTGTVPVDGVDDGKVDLVAFDPIGAICMLDAVANTQPSCLVVPVPQDDGIELFYGDFAPDPDDDLVIAVPGPAAVQFNALPKFRVAAGGITSDTAPASASTPGEDARLTGADLDTANGPRVIVQVSKDGELACTTVRPAGIQPCNQ